MKKRISDLHIFSVYDYDEFLENGFDTTKTSAHYSLNPYNKHHFKKTPNHLNFVSYSLVLTGSRTLKSYLRYETLFSASFEIVFNKYKIHSIEFVKNEYVLSEYSEFCFFCEDLRRGLREQAQINFVLDDFNLVINCNYDLIPSLFFYNMNRGAQKKILEIFSENGLFVTSLDNPTQQPFHPTT